MHVLIDFVDMVLYGRGYVIVFFASIHFRKMLQIHGRCLNSLLT